MLTTVSLQSELKTGEEISYESDEHMLYASFTDNKFKIWFNGTYVHISHTFKSFERKLNQLVKEYGLERAQ